MLSDRDKVKKRPEIRLAPVHQNSALTDAAQQPFLGNPGAFCKGDAKSA
jgi:hypothetical protein